MALMTIMALLMMAAAPSLLMDVKRGKEEEAIGRGEEVQQAILVFLASTGRLPKSMDELLEGVSLPGRTKKLMILRQSAAIDPLSSSGEWKTIQHGDNKTLAQFQRKLASYTGNNTFSNPRINGIYASQANAILNAAAGRSINIIVDAETDEDTEPPGGEDDSQNIDAPFIAVMSRSQRKSVISYYGIERHDYWVFTPLFRGRGP
jgi:type II secretory pathway pseudopilin PulG